MLCPNPKTDNMRSSLSSTLWVNVNVFNQFKTTEFSLNWSIFLNFGNILEIFPALLELS